MLDWLIGLYYRLTLPWIMGRRPRVAHPPVIVFVGVKKGVNGYFESWRLPSGWRLKAVDDIAVHVGTAYGDTKEDVLAGLNHHRRDMEEKGYL